MDEFRRYFFYSFVQRQDGAEVGFAAHAGGQTSVRHRKYPETRLLTPTVFVCELERWVRSELGGEEDVVDQGNRWHPFLVLFPHTTLCFLRVEIMVGAFFQRYRTWRTFVSG
jgi:hypothetical protein